MTHFFNQQSHNSLTDTAHPKTACEVSRQGILHPNQADKAAEQKDVICS